MSTSTGKTILLAEDEAAIAEVISLLLEDAGFQVIHAADGAEALTLLETNTPDLLLLDVMMPNKDGFEVAHEARQMEKLNHAEIVFLTAKGDETSRRKGYAEGAEQYLSKPFDNQDLVDRISELLK